MSAMTNILFSDGAYQTRSVGWKLRVWFPTLARYSQIDRPRHNLERIDLY